MSNYTKSTNFATKDALSSGNPLKIVKGTEIDTEFNNIATAISTKTDNANAAITGGSIVGITDLAVTDGGTGASSASGARTNLGAAASGANSDITSLTGLTTALSVAQGGTGSTSITANNVILGNGTSAVQVVAPGTTGNILTSNGTTWTSAAPAISFVGFRGQVYTSGTNTFTIPSGITALKITVVGGGGSGAGDNSCAFVDGNSGSTSSVSSGTQTISTISATGGSGATSSSLISGGLGSGGDLNGRGGRGGGGTTGAVSIFSSTTIGAASVLGAGGSGVSTGGAGGSAIKFLTGLTPGNTLSATVGAGGAQVGVTAIGYAGGAGVVLIEW
jgi:hypothetical protein